MAAVGLGRYASAAEACPVWVDTHVEAEPQQPGPDLSKLYDRMFKAYRPGYQQMFDFWHALDNLKRGN